MLTIAQYDCVISAFQTQGVASCPSALDTACTCIDDPYQDWLYTCVTSNCTVKEQLMSKKISSVQCGVGEFPFVVDIMVAMYALFAAASVLTIVRVVVKLMGHGGGWGMDDWLMVPAYVSKLGLLRSIGAETLQETRTHTYPLLPRTNEARTSRGVWLQSLPFPSQVSLSLSVAVRKLHR